MVRVDPRTVSEERLQTLARLGFNRLSFGVQDFDPAVQKAVHRVQPADQVFSLVQSARKIGFESINVDLIYGLPKQNLDAFRRTGTTRKPAAVKEMSFLTWSSTDVFSAQFGMNFSRVINQ